MRCLLWHTSKAMLSAKGCDETAMMTHKTCENGFCAYFFLCGMVLVGF